MIVADPWLKFYTSDWRSDPALKICSLAARGLWIEIICLMHEAHPYGHLLLNGNSPTDAQLGVLVGAPPEQITEILGELESAGVFSRTRAGVIYSRKLTRMAKKAATARINGRRGGNPKLGKEREIQPSDKGKVKGGDKPQKPEARKSSVEAKASPGATAPPDPVKIMFDSGRSLLMAAGKSSDAAGKLLGKWRSDHGPEAVIAALGKAQREGAIDPVSFIEGCLRHSGRKAQAAQIGERRTNQAGQTIEYAGENQGWVKVWD